MNGLGSLTRVADAVTRGSALVETYPWSQIWIDRSTGGVESFDQDLDNVAGSVSNTAKSQTDAKCIPLPLKLL